MPELGGMVCPLAFAVGAAAAGAGTALLARAAGGREGQESPSVRQAAARALLPPAAVLLLPLVSLAQNDRFGPFAELHALWHRLETLVHASPLAHGALHAGNALLLLLAAVCAWRTLYAAARMWTFARALRGQARETAAGTYFLLSSERPLCFTLGLRTPTVYLTTGLRERLSEAELAVVLAHERAHARRRDGALNAFLVLFYTLLPVPGSSV
jgi:Zn-dependent protease with chaperone function